MNTGFGGGDDGGDHGSVKERACLPSKASLLQVVTATTGILFNKKSPHKPGSALMTHWIRPVVLAIVVQAR